MHFAGMSYGLHADLMPFKLEDLKEKLYDKIVILPLCRLRGRVKLSLLLMEKIE
jgi:hypothetical protein